MSIWSHRYVESIWMYHTLDISVALLNPKCPSKKSADTVVWVVGGY